MKHIKSLVLLASLFAGSIQVQAQAPSPDTMIHKLFATLKNKDEKGFVALYPNGQQMVKLVRNMLEQMFKSDAMQQMMQADEKSKNLNVDSLINLQVAKTSTPEAQAEMVKSFSKIFERIVEKGEKKGVNWSDAQLVSYTIDSAAAMDEGGMDMFGGAGLKTAKGVIDFTSGGTAFQMKYDKVLFLQGEGGWYGGEFSQVIKKGESIEPDAVTDEEVTDSIATVDPPKSKVKTKTKTPTTKTKVKTKTPARKPATKS